MTKKNAKIIVLAFITGTILGLFYYQFASKVYEAKMILLSDILTSSYSERITESLYGLIKERNTKVLSEKFQMSEREVAEIVQINIETFKAKNNPEKEPNEIFVVIVRVLNNDILPKLQQSIVTFLRNNEFITIRVAQRKKYTVEIIKKIDEQLSALEQLKAKITRGEFTQGGKENVILFDPTTVHTKIVDLNKERTNLLNSLETLNSIQVVEGFTVFEKPVSPRLSLSLAGGASLGLFFVGMVISLKAVRKMINFSENKLGES